MTRLVILAEERSGDHFPRWQPVRTPEYSTTHRKVVTASGGGIDIGSVYLDGRRSEHAFPFRITFRLDFDLAQINRHTDFISDRFHHCHYRFVVWTALEVDNSDLHVLPFQVRFSIDESAFMAASNLSSTSAAPHCVRQRRSSFSTIRTVTRLSAALMAAICVRRSSAHRCSSTMRRTDPTCPSIRLRELHKDLTCGSSR